jgi:hypothetical protein
MKRIISYFMVLLCIIVICQGFACTKSEYKKITIKNDLSSYSLEYPSHYKKEVGEVLDFDIPFTLLILNGPIITETAEVFDPDTGIITVVGNTGSSIISISISNYKIYFGESYSATEKIEAVLKGEAEWENFQLLERSPITVSGVEGELIVYLVDRLMPIPVEDGENLEYVRAVYFDYNDLTWEIEMQCNQDIQEEVTAYFNHVIETFEILE